ncbi:MAG: hypothetical protein K8R23_04100 [Chthoniobacter sp.]|nr:hypothetical protein [Chthoniobacter sp.]
MRLKLILIGAGCVVAYLGWQELTLARHAKADPVEVSAADLESGKIPENCHVIVKDALALYPASVYHYKKKKYSSGETNDSTRTTDVLYPVISMNHPFSKAMASGTADDKEIESALSSVGIIVKTNRFSTIGSIPKKMDSPAKLQGLVLNHIEKLDSKDANLLRSSFPRLDAEKVVIIEESRTPKSLGSAIGMMAGGALLSLGVVVFSLRKAAA